ncbi:MAG: metallophosphoesterase family protein [Clostridia bacterium]|nr:metallophosphoesterase family protein [Clostridia bacterium]
MRELESLVADMMILVLSDTHFRRPGERLPRDIEEAAATADLIVHCGDFEALSAYEYLGKLGQLVAVRGNMDEPALKEFLPETVTFEAAGRKIGVVHGRGAPRGLAERAAGMFSGVDAVLFGHSHQPYREVKDGVLLFNPGSPTDRVFAPYNAYGIVAVTAEGIQARTVRV